MRMCKLPSSKPPSNLGGCFEVIAVYGVVYHKRRREKSCMNELDQFVQSVIYSSRIANSQQKHMTLQTSKYGRHSPSFSLVSMLGSWLWVRALDQSLSHGRVRAGFCNGSRGTGLHPAARQSRHRLSLLENRDWNNRNSTDLCCFK